MVYCGKASQGCQNCRTRRIKCDKIRPECTQCVRVGKKCPGYRDQLSLMFRDESEKVIQKAHAQWGVENGESSSAGASSASGQTLTPPDESPTSSTPWSISPTTPASSTMEGRKPSVSALQARKAARRNASVVLIKQEPGEEHAGVLVASHRTSISTTKQPLKFISPTLLDQGIDFYINKFIVGQPDQAITPIDIPENSFIQNPLVRDMMAAIGLAALSNLRNDEGLKTLAFRKYGEAISRTNSTVTTSNKVQAHALMRAIVMLAIFEIVKGSHSSAMTHIRGAVALIRSKFLDRSPSPSLAFRGLLQLICTLFIPCQCAGIPLPGIFHESFELRKETAAEYDPGDQTATEAIVIIAQYVQLSAYVRNHALTDGRPHTSAIIQQTLAVEDKLAAWEKRQQGKWLFGTVADPPDLPRQAAFGGRLHTYADQWVARLWNHYRWARILVNEMIIDFAQRYPTSSLPLVSAAQQARCLEVTERLAEDTLVSLPTHWRHPALKEEQIRFIEKTSGGAGVGAAGIPSLLHQIQVAGCAPGVPDAFWDWALAILETVWSELGMLNARSLAEVMRAHRDKVKLEQPDGILGGGFSFLEEAVVPF